MGAFSSKDQKQVVYIQRIIAQRKHFYSSRENRDVERRYGTKARPNLAGQTRTKVAHPASGAHDILTSLHSAFV